MEHDFKRLRQQNALFAKRHGVQLYSDRHRLFYIGDKLKSIGEQRLLFPEMSHRNAILHIVHFLSGVLLQRFMV